LHDIDQRIVDVGALRSGVAAITASVLVSLAIGGAVTALSPGRAAVFVLASAAAAAGVVVTAVHGLRAVATLALVGAAATLGMNGVRITSFMSAADAFLFIAALGLLLDPASWRRLDLGRARLQALGFLLIVTGGTLGSLFAGDALASMAILLRLIVGSAFVVLLFLTWMPNVRELRAVAWAWVVSAVVTSVAALVGDASTYGRPTGLTTHPNHLALVCVLAIGPAIALTASSSGARRLVGVVACAVISAGVFVSGSRAGLLGYITVLLLAFLLSRRTSSLRAGLGAGAVVVGLWGAGAVAGALLLMRIIDLPTGSAVARLTGRVPGVRESDAEREAVLAEGLARAGAHPLTGSGFEGALSAHNIYLQIWAAAGLLGLAGFLTIIAASLAPLRMHVARLVDRRDGRLASLGLGFGASLAGYTVAGFFHVALWDRYIWLTPAVLAVVVVLARQAKPVVSRPRRSRALPDGRSGELESLRA
jgi:hypothetical protein